MQVIKKKNFFFILFFFIFFQGIFSVKAEYICNISTNPYFTFFTTAKTESGGDFKSAFEALKKKYQNEVNDAFNKNIEEISKSVYGAENSHEKACTPFIKKNQTNISDFSKERMKKFWEYECALQNITISVENNTILFSEGIDILKTQEYILLDEITNSHAALTKTLQMYAEMRQWYPVHRDLECLISEMEIYRTSLRKFIEKVILLPAKFYNYGSEKQQS